MLLVMPNSAPLAVLESLLTMPYWGLLLLIYKEITKQLLFAVLFYVGLYLSTRLRRADLPLLGTV